LKIKIVKLIQKLNATIHSLLQTQRDLYINASSVIYFNSCKQSS